MHSKQIWGHQPHQKDLAILSAGLETSGTAVIPVFTVSIPVASRKNRRLTLEGREEFLGILNVSFHGF